MRTAVATLALVGSAFFVACGGGGSSKTSISTSANTTASPAATKAAPTSAASATPGVPTVTPAPVTTPPPPPPPPSAATEPPAPPPTTAPPPPPAPTEAPPPPPPPPAGGGTLTIAAVNVLFDTKSLSATTGPITIVFNNQDNAVAHNIQFFSGSTSIGMTEIATGPDTQTLSLGTLAPGSYSYKCDVHPTTMTGTLIVS